MMLEVFAIFDNKARAFNQPFYFPTVEVAQRAFRTVTNDETSQIHKSPADYELFHLGRFDDATGTFELLSQRASLGLAAIYKE